jgi:uncharacterized repeat protein (TIGR01451 family)
VAFASAATNLVDTDNNGEIDIFVHDLQMDETTRVSIATDGTPGNGSSYVPSISSDGRYVAFESMATTLVSGDTNGHSDIFVRDRQLDITVRVSVATDGTQGDAAATDAAISGDGRYVAFASDATNLVADDANGNADAFVHDRDADEDDFFDEAGATETTRVSVPNCGGEATGASEGRPTLSDGGRYVVFRSAAQNLVGGDIDDIDTFVRDQALGQTAFVSNVPGVEGVYQDTCRPAISGDGQSVAFETGDCVNGGQIYVRDRGDLPPANAPTDLLHVTTGGSDTPGCGETSSPCRTVQQAVDQAACGATVQVATGTYSGVHPWVGETYTTTQLVYLNHPITITGGFTLSNWTTPDPSSHPTILDAEGLGQGIVIGDAPTVTLEGLRIVNGQTTENGGGVGTREYQSHLTIRACDVLSNAAQASGSQSYAFGGGVYLSSGTLVLEDSLLMNNTSSDLGGGVHTRNATVTMTNNLLQKNSGWVGGGASLYESTCYVADNTFQDNLAGYSGGGLDVGGDGNLLLIQNDFLDNTASKSGGGLYAEVNAGYAHTMTHNLFQGNVADANGSGAGGGARLFGDEGAQLSFHHNQVVGNYAATGATSADGGRGGGVFVLGPALIADNLFQGNWASSAPPQSGFHYGGYGGGLYLMGSDLRVERNRILDNRAARNAGFVLAEAHGGGVHVTYNTIVTMTNNIVAGNRYCDECTLLSGQNRGGGAISIGGATTPTDTQLYILHNTIADNQSPALFNESAFITMSHSILAGHDVDLRSIFDSSEAGGGRPPTTVSDYTLWWPSMTSDIISGTWTHTRDVTGDPDFASCGLDDYHLSSTSAAIDQGAGADLSDDIDGHPRPILSGYDLGADEYTGVDLSPSVKRVTPLDAAAGEVVTFTIALHNDGPEDAAGVSLSDPVPTHTTYIPHTAQATSGTLTDTDGIRWSGTIIAGGTVTVTLQVTVTEEVVIENTAVVTDTYGTPHTMTARVNEDRIYLPLVWRSS